MVGLAPEVTTEFLKGFLNECRKIISQLSLNINRLPRWLNRAKVRFGWINDSLVAVFDDSNENDEYDFLGHIDADIVALLNVENFIPTGYSVPVPDNKSVIIMQGENSGSTIFNMTGEYPAFLNCGLAGHYNPILLVNLLFYHSPVSNLLPGPKVARFVNFALYIHKREVENRQHFWSLCRDPIVSLLNNFHSKYGNYYESLAKIHNIFNVTKESSVIVLGKDTNSELQDLIQLCDYLTGKGYKAHLIKDLPEVPMMSNEEKVRSWVAAPRFCVMIDKKPSGHILEYLILKQQRCILGLLRPEGSGSTRMIGDDNLVDVNFIRTFEFKHTPLEIIDSVINWAENIASNRQKAYNDEYPWRKHL
jgi:hypothetical protein